MIARDFLALVCLGFLALVTAKPQLNWHGKHFEIYKQHFRTGLQRFPVDEREHAKEELVKYLNGEIERPAFFEVIAAKHVDLLDDEQKSELTSYIEGFDVSTLPERQLTGSASPHGEGHEDHFELTDALSHISPHEWESKYFDVYKQHLKTGLQKFPVGERAHALEELVKFLKGERPKPAFFEPIAEKHMKLLDADQKAEFLEFAEHLDVSTLPEEELTGKASPHAVGHVTHHELTELLTHISGHDWHDKYFEIYKQHLRTGLQRFPVDEREHAKEEFVKYLKGEIERPAFFEPVADRHVALLDAVQKAELISYAEHFDVSSLPDKQLTGEFSPHAEGHVSHQDLTVLLSHISGHDWHEKYFDIYKQYFKTGLRRFAAADRQSAKDQFVHYLKKEARKPAFFEPVADRHVKLLDAAQRAEFIEFVENFDVSTLPEERIGGTRSPHSDCEHLDLAHLLTHISGEEWHDIYFDVYKQHFTTGLQKFPLEEREHAKQELLKYFKGEGEKPDFFEPVAEQHFKILDAVQKTEFVAFVEHFDVSTLPEHQFTGSGSPHGEGHERHYELTAHLSHISNQEWHSRYFAVYKQHFETGLEKLPQDKREDGRLQILKYLKGQAERPEFLEPIADRHIKLLDAGQKDEFISYIEHFDVSTLSQYHFGELGSPHADGHEDHHELTQLLTHISGFDWYEKYFEIYKQHFKTGLQKFPVGEREHAREELLKYLKEEVDRPAFFEPIADKHLELLDPVQKSEFFDFVEHFDLSSLPEEQIGGTGSPHANGHHDHYELTSLLSHISAHDWHDKYFVIYKEYFETGLQKFSVDEREHVKEELVKYFKGQIAKPDYFEPVADKHVDLLDAAQKTEFVHFIENFDVSSLPSEQITEAGSPHHDVEKLQLADELSHISGHEWYDTYFDIYKQHLKTGLLKFPVGEREHAKEQLLLYLKGEGDKPDFLEPVAVQHLNVLDAVQKAEFISFAYNLDCSSLPEHQFTEEGSPHGDGHTAHDKLTEVADLH